jgi:hypothetical protein
MVIQDDVEIDREEKTLIDKLIEKIVNQLPEEIPTKDLAKYVNMQYVSTILQEVMIESEIDTSIYMGGDIEDEEINFSKSEASEEEKKDL